MANLRAFAKKNKDRQNLTHGIKDEAKVVYQNVYDQFCRSHFVEFHSRIQVAKQHLDDKDFLCISQDIAKVNALSILKEPRYLSTQVSAALKQFNLLEKICTQYRSAIDSANPYPRLDDRLPSDSTGKRPPTSDSSRAKPSHLRPNYQMRPYFSSGLDRPQNALAFLDESFPIADAAKLDRGKRRAKFVELHDRLNHVHAMQIAEQLVRDNEQQVADHGACDEAYARHKIANLKASEDELSVKHSLAEKLSARLDALSVKKKSYLSELHAQIAYWKAEGFDEAPKLSKYLLARVDSISNQLDERDWPPSSFI